MVYILIFLNIFVYFLPQIINFGGYSSVQTFMTMWQKDNYAIADGEYYRLISSAFLHNGFLHLAVNMYSLYIIGPIIIQAFSTIGFAIIFLLSAIAGSLMSYLFNPHYSVGASGAIAGLVGALLVYAVINNQMQAVQNILFIIGLNLAIAFYINSQTNGGGIDNWGHLGGFLAGGVISLILLQYRDQLSF